MNARSRADLAAAVSQRDLVTIPEAMARARVCRRTIHYWIARAQVDSVRTAGGRIRIYADTLLVEHRPRR